MEWTREVLEGEIESSESGGYSRMLQHLKVLKFHPSEILIY